MFSDYCMRWLGATEGAQQTMSTQKTQPIFNGKIEPSDCKCSSEAFLWQLAANLSDVIQYVVASSGCSERRWSTERGSVG